MDVVEAINTRKSIRAFKPDQVPQAVLQNILELALRAPSWGNSQPWDFVIVAGSKLEEIEQGFNEKAEQEPTPDIARPQEFPEPYGSRRRARVIRPLQTTEGSTDTANRRPQNPLFFGAPCIIYICTGRSFYFQSKGINSWPIFDCGAIEENIMLLATNYGLGTIALARSVRYPDVIRKVVGIPDSILIVLGIAIGYPDWADPVNQRQSSREPLSKVAKWYGFD